MRRQHLRVRLTRNPRQEIIQDAQNMVEATQQFPATKSHGAMKKPELIEFRDLLEDMQSRLRGDVRQLTKEALGTDRQDGGGESKSPTHMAELGSDTFEQDFSLSLAANEQETLTEITAALQRIKDGTFGLCEICTKDGKSPTQSTIPKPRLRAIPYARTCVDCARRREGF
jgi:DnaK suppressor protein